MQYWQDKAFREAFEIGEFARYYEKIRGRKLEIVRKREKPDYVVKDRTTDELFAVELTSVYLSDRSVFEEHMHAVDGQISYDSSVMNTYKQRILHAVKEKIRKARKGYELTYPLLLSVYVNEYISIYMETDDWQGFEANNTEVFRDMAPFQEILFWPLPNDDAYLIGGGNKGKES